MKIECQLVCCDPVCQQLTIHYHLEVFFSLSLSLSTDPVTQVFFEKHLGLPKSGVVLPLFEVAQLNLFFKIKKSYMS